MNLISIFYSFAFEQTRVIPDASQGCSAVQGGLDTDAPQPIFIDSQEELMTQPSRTFQSLLLVLGLTLGASTFADDTPHPYKGRFFS